MNSKSLRKRRAVIDKISSIHLANIRSPVKSKIFDVYDGYLDSADFTEEEIETFHAILDQRLITNVSEYVEPRMAAKTIRISEVEDLIEKQPFPYIRDLLWNLLDTWKMKYIGPVVALAEIVDDEQNIHTEDVEKKTTDGVILLGKVPVPENQKTLAEFEAAIRESMLPVKYDTRGEMIAYLSSQTNGLPEELKEALTKEYTKAKMEEARAILGLVYTSSILSARNFTSSGSRIVRISNIREGLISSSDIEPFEGGEYAEEVEWDDTMIHRFGTVQTLEGVKCKFSVKVRVSKVESHTTLIAHFTESNNSLPSETAALLYSAYYRAYYEKLYAAESKIKETLDDMKEWGKRPSVMKKGENVYKATLRGLWAKIKTYEPELKGELIKRLFEEAYEAVGLCADGHVGRLCNVLVGFDPEFSCSLSPMEYFQNNIALIAGNIHAPQSTKILQAKALMDDVKMPEEEREAWLEAL